MKRENLERVEESVAPKTPIFELDDNYPSEPTLEAIRRWRGENFREFFAALKPVWMYSEPGGWCGWHESDAIDEVFDESVRRYELSTGGWSGNEDLIGAMQRNFVLWGMTWVQERRGGHYIFEVKG